MITDLFLERNSMIIPLFATKRLFRSGAILLLMTTLGGCATSYSPSSKTMGASRDEVIAQLGPPDPAPRDLSTASRLDFPRGPYGKHTYSVYFDESGRVNGFRQLLTEENFAKIKPGMTTGQVVDLIGVSRDTFGLARNRGFVWNYRYITPFCQWFQVEFTLENTVRSTGFGMPPECRRRRGGLF